jgi:hypothetical protein
MALAHPQNEKEATRGTRRNRSLETRFSSTGDYR